MYFQRVDIRALSITADYLPRRLNIVAMRAGSKAEVRLYICMRLCICISVFVGSAFCLLSSSWLDGSKGGNLASQGAHVFVHVGGVSFRAPLGPTGAKEART